jgi:hypothetical protein
MEVSSSDGMELGWQECARQAKAGGEMCVLKTSCCLGWNAGYSNYIAKKQMRDG